MINHKRRLLSTKWIEWRYPNTKSPYIQSNWLHSFWKRIVDCSRSSTLLHPNWRTERTRFCRRTDVRKNTSILKLRVERHQGSHRIDNYVHAELHWREISKRISLRLDWKIFGNCVDVIDNKIQRRQQTTDWNGQRPNENLRATVRFYERDCG